MVDLGYKEADTVYNYEGFSQYFTGINLRDAFYEYCDNEEFREVIDTGLFRYADGCYVIDDDKYVSQDVAGEYMLTEYARDHLDECVLHFTYRRIDVRLHGHFHTDSFHRSNRNLYEELPQYNEDRNTAIIDNAEELRRNRQAFEQSFSDYRVSAQTFWDKADALMKQRHWYPDTFKEKTLLNDMEYSRYKNERDKAPSLPKVMAICIGLDIDLQTSEDLLASAGHKLSPIREHQAYRFALMHYRGRIDECNDFLTDRGFNPLGSQSRK